MIFTEISPDEADQRVLELIRKLAEAVQPYLYEPRRWSGTLRRLQFARAVQGSNTIEGYHASLDDVLDVVEGEEPLDAQTETQLAIAGYRDAMTYVLQIARDHTASIDASLIKSLHFLITKHEMKKHPGQWRPGAVFVRRESDGEVVYEGPDAELVPGLIQEMSEQLAGSEASPMIRAAVAHLNLVMIHPFSDGNGRMARCLQSLVLAQEGLLSPVLSSIEEYLGANTQAYYDVLAEVGQGSWHPENDVRPWIKFNLTAHYRQIQTMRRRINEIEELWGRIEELVTKHSVPDRAVGALTDSSRGLRLRNVSYRNIVKSATGLEISDQVATRDLKSLVEAKLLIPNGEGRSRTYRGADELLNVWADVRSRRPKKGEDDPYKL